MSARDKKAKTQSYHRCQWCHNGEAVRMMIDREEWKRLQKHLPSLNGEEWVCEFCVDRALRSLGQ